MVNQATGDRLWFTCLPASPADPLIFECELPAHAPGTPLHLHTRIAERFECLEGELSMIAGAPSRPVVLTRGHHIDVPIGSPHRFWNATDRPVRFKSTVTPGADFERFLRSVYALGNSGRVGPTGMPRSPLQLAVLREASDLYFAGVPLPIQRPIFAALSAIAGVVGTRRRLAHLATSTLPLPQRSS
jgi:mannose-6-phosphate isomerase-like protein (cupin superfamily)